MHWCVINLLQGRKASSEANELLDFTYFLDWSKPFESIEIFVGPELFSCIKCIRLQEWCGILLDYRYNENLELEDAIHTAILTLKVSINF